MVRVAAEELHQNAYGYHFQSVEVVQVTLDSCRFLRFMEYYQLSEIVVDGNLIRDVVK